ncbi:MAG: hypothetical protein ACE5KG_03565 [Nitrososphaerales archaeon]
MKIGILVSGLVLLVIGYIMAKLGGDPSEHPEGVTYLGVNIDMGTMFLLGTFGTLIFLLGIVVTFVGAVIWWAKKEKKEDRF